jgi:hypothetical protein
LDGAAVASGGGLRQAARDVAVQGVVYFLLGYFVSFKVLDASRSAAALVRGRCRRGG